MSELFEFLTSVRSPNLNLNIELPIEVDQEKLLIDFDTVHSRFIESPQSGSYHNGGWKVIGLITSGGDVKEDRPGFIVGKPFLPSPALNFCPYIQTFLEQLPARKKRVRFMSLAPKCEIKWHYDLNLTIDKNTNSNTARFHIPIITNPQVEFQICHNVFRWQPGHFYYGDFSFPHRVENQGNTSRIHLVIDIIPDTELINLFPASFLKEEPVRHHFRKQYLQAYSNYLKKTDGFSDIL